jgi:hypothetical protein
MKNNENGMKKQALRMGGYAKTQSIEAVRNEIFLIRVMKIA